MTEEEKRRLREKTKEYMLRPPDAASLVGPHYHFCRVCQEDHECLEDDCELAREVVCHNCFDEDERVRMSIPR